MKPRRQQKQTARGINVSIEGESLSIFKKGNFFFPPLISFGSIYSKHQSSHCLFMDRERSHGSLQVWGQRILCQDSSSDSSWVSSWICLQLVEVVAKGSLRLFLASSDRWLLITAERNLRWYASNFLAFCCFLDIYFLVFSYLMQWWGNFSFFWMRPMSQNLVWLKKWMVNL